MEKTIPINEGEYTIEKLPEIYRVTEPLRGYAIIINNYKFNKLAELEGGEEDSHRLENTFKGLQFEVDLRENKSAEEMKDIFNQYGERNHTEYGCFVCVLSSHGGREKIYGSDDTPVSIYDLIRVIISCSSLKEKPKLFFIDACRSFGKDGFVFDEQTGCKDCFICFSTLAGASAKMMANLPWKGSTFLKVFCDIFRKHGEQVDLLRLLQKLKNALDDITKNSQTVEIRDCLPKSVVFTAGWWVCHECHGLSKTNKCMTRTCYVYKDGRDEADTEELRQMLRDFSRDLYTWISQTHEIVEELNLLSKDLDEHFRNINIAKVSGAAGAIAGGVMTVFGLILIPFTFGGSIALSVAGGALAGAGGATVGGSAAVNAVLAKNRRETAESLLRKYSDMSTKIKHRCLFISTMLERYGEIENDFPDWLQFWSKAVTGTNGWSDWKDILEILDSAFGISSASLRATAQVGAAALRIGGAGASVGLHVVGGVAGLLFTPLDIFTLVDSAIDIHKKNPHQVSNDIRSLADNIKTICPTQKEVDKMIHCTIANL